MPTVVNAIAGPAAADASLVEAPAAVDAACSDFERRLMADHAGYGCICVWVVAAGEAWPFVFHNRPFKRVIPGAQLIYCRDIESFVRFSRPLSRFLIGKGKLIVRVDANGPIEGPKGIYFEGMEPRFCKGAAARPGDLAYTQMAMCPFVRA